MKNPLEELNSALDARLGESERASMRAAFSAYLDEHPLEAPVLSPYRFALPYGAAFAFLLLLVALPTGYAAERSLPGDALYGVKLNAEKAVVALASLSEESEARAHVALVDRRLSEAETLIAIDEDTPETLALLATAATESAEAVQEIVGASESGDGSIRDTGEELEARLGAHEHILEVIADGEEAAPESFTDAVSDLREEAADVNEAADDRAPESAPEDAFGESEKEAASAIDRLGALLEGVDPEPGSFEEKAALLLQEAQGAYEEGAAGREKDVAASVDAMERARGTARQGILLLAADDRLPEEAE